ncbi:hypothetical protein [Streptomyces sp. NPDC047974]
MPSCSRTGDLEEARFVAGLLHADLGARLQRCTDALEAHGISHPF